MNRIDKTFQRLKEEKKTAFIGFLTAGDPDIKTSIECMKEMEKNGCDLIEIGVPFSDPCAEGPLIQEANVRALRHNIKTDDIMDMVKEIRKQSSIPLLYLLYYNQIFKYGSIRFLDACASCGIDGLIVPDLPYEHQDELYDIAQARGIHLISLVTPVSAKRKQQVCAQSKGFLYCVTSTGVTGIRDTFDTDLKAFIEELRNYSDTPKALGFGISKVSQVQELKHYAEGIIVGSAIVQEIANISTGENSPQDVGLFVKKLADACHQ